MYTVHGFPICEFYFVGVSCWVVVDLDDFWVETMDGLCHHHAVGKVAADVSCGLLDKYVLFGAG